MCHAGGAESLTADKSREHVVIVLQLLYPLVILVPVFTRILLAGA
jgi:hypothetical protein